MDEDRRRHLEMIQAVIARMASNSFALKGWSVAAATALLAFAAGTRHAWVAGVALLPVLAFWALDGYYLALEQRFRRLYCAVAGLPPPDETAPPPAPAAFQMSVQDHAAKHPWRRAVLSRSVWPIHGVTAATVALIAGIVSAQPAEAEKPARVEIADTVFVHVLQAPAPAAPPRTSPPPGPRTTP